MEIYVVRHGQVPSNIEGIISGWSDEELTDTGIKQANKIKDELSNIEFSKVYSSPVYRAIQTAEIVSPKKEIILDNRIAERKPGNLLGKSRKEIDRTTWNSLTAKETTEGAETLLEGINRTEDFLNEVRKNNKNNDEKILIVTHNFISKCIWIIENKINDESKINKFYHDNADVKIYTE